MRESAGAKSRCNRDNGGVTMPAHMKAVQPPTKASNAGSSKNSFDVESAVAEIHDEVAGALVAEAEREAALEANEVTEMAVEADETIEAPGEPLNFSYRELVTGEPWQNENVLVGDSGKARAGGFKCVTLTVGASF